MFPTLSKFILIALLLLGQASSMAHELDLDAHQGNDICQVCLLHSAQDDTQPAAAFNIAVNAPDYAPQVFLPTALSSRTFGHFQSRAPPLLNAV
jgi:hypothetical protein